MFNLAEKLFFRKITSGSNQQQHPNEETEKHLLSDIFYFICGIDTQNLKYYGENEIFINPNISNPDILKSIKNLAIQIRSFERFIFENEYSSDSLKRIFATELEQSIHDFQLHITLLRSDISSIEEFLIKISHHIDLFDELERIVEIISERSGDILVNILKERMDKMVQFNEFYEKIIEKFAIDINQRIFKFVNEGTIQMPFFMVKEKTEFGFNEKYFSDKFFIEQSYVPFYVKDTNIILKSGLYTNLLRKIKCHLSDSQNINEHMIQPDFSYDNIELSTFELSNFDLLMNLIEKDHKVKYDILNQYFSEIFFIECENIKKYIFFFGKTFIQDALHETNTDIFSKNPECMTKINRAINNKSIRLKISKSSLMTHLSRILNIEINYEFDEELSILDGLTIEYTPSELFLLFFSKKSISELELIFRMIHTLQIISYSITKEEKTNFSNLILSLNNYFISAFYTRYILREILTISVDDMNTFIKKVENLIKISLKDFYLTSYDVFKSLGLYFIICFKYIKYKKVDFENLENIIKELSSTIDNENHNIFLAYTLYNMKESNLNK